MSCAGQLYTPMFGVISRTPEKAYTIAHDHALFDIGYAKDISAIVAAMTHTALRTNSVDSILDTAAFIDLEGYQDSRLIGRISDSVADASVKNILATKAMILKDSLTALDSPLLKIPKNFTATQKKLIKQESVYQYLEKR